jgi:hypothetical protein
VTNPGFAGFNRQDATVAKVLTASQTNHAKKPHAGRQLPRVTAGFSTKSTLVPGVTES